MGDLKHELKEKIIEAPELEDIEPTDIVDDEPLFVDGINLKADSEETRQHFTSINALAALVESQRAK